MGEPGLYTLPGLQLDYRIHTGPRSAFEIVILLPDAELVALMLEQSGTINNIELRTVEVWGGPQVKQVPRHHLGNLGLKSPETSQPLPPPRQADQSREGGQRGGERAREGGQRNETAQASPPPGYADNPQPLNSVNPLSTIMIKTLGGLTAVSPTRSPINS